MVRAGYERTATGWRSTGAQSGATSRNVAAVRAGEAKAAGDRARTAQAAAKKAAGAANKKANAARAARADQGGRPKATPKRKRAI